jgi:uncharacterized protein YgiM (DUF1202 family)
MKKTFVLILCLALASLACLQEVPSAGVIVPAAANLPDKIVSVTPGSNVLASTTLSADDGETCARVTAETAQNLRAAPGIDAQILGHMKSGEVVQVVNRLDPEWWLIERGGQMYYARSLYLQEAECGGKDGN